MLPYNFSQNAYPITMAEDSGAWSVTVGQDTYAFGADEAAAQAFAAAAVHTPGLVEWLAGSKALLLQMESLLTEGNRLKQLYDDNELFTLLLAVPPGQTPPGTRLSLIRILSIGALFQDLTDFLAEDAVGNPTAGVPLPTRRKIITVRD